MKAFYSKIKGENPFYVCPLIKDYASVHLSYTCPPSGKNPPPVSSIKNTKILIYRASLIFQLNKLG